MFDYSALQQGDPEIFAATMAEFQREQDKIELIASENFTSPAVMAAQGSVLTNKYAEGYPAARYYGGCECVDVVENIARERACTLFGAEHANVQPHSGSQANMAAYMAVLQPGDTVLGMDLDHGGHLTHGSKANFSGKLYNFASYGVDAETECINYDALEQQAMQIRPRLIVAGASAYPRIIDFERFRAIADKCGALLMTDMAHIAGLVAANEHPSPIPYCDIVTTTTHKTLRGPRGGMILCREQYAKAIDRTIFPGMQGGPLMHVVAAKAVALHEAMQPEFVQYIRALKANAQAMADELLHYGLRLVSGGTDNHLMLVDLRPIGLTGRKAELMLDEVGITCNKNAIPFDPESHNVTSGIRLGTAAITTRGFDEADTRKVAQAIRSCLNGDENAARAAVRELTQKHPLYGWSK